MNLFTKLRSRSLAHVTSARGRAEWRVLCALHSACGQLGTLTGVLDFFESRERPPGFFLRRDSFLRALLAAHRDSKTRGLTQALFFAIYSSLLTKAASPVCSLVDSNDAHAETVCVFLELLERLSLQRNRDIHTAIIRRVPEIVRDWAAREARRVGRNAALEFVSESDRVDAERPKLLRSGWELDLASSALAELESRSVIDRDARRLLQQNIVEHRSIGELAISGPQPLSYEACKKRLQRARRSIRDYLSTSDMSLAALALAELEKNSIGLVPSELGEQREEETKGTRS